MVERRDGDIEIRAYNPLIAAEVDVHGGRSEAINAGFRLLAGYIFGDNKAAQKIAMTAPVTQQASGAAWKVRFIMPSDWTLDTLPQPNDPRVRLMAEPRRRFAAIRFSGWSSDRNLAEHRDRLMNWVRVQNVATDGEPLVAFYIAPWTLPFMKRTEFLIALKD